MDNERILIIDDETDFCKLVKRNLELINNVEVAIAGDGEEGLSAVKKLKPALIILDVMMPGLNGFEVLKRLKSDSNTEAIPVIMLSARGDDATRDKCMQLRVADYITKPIEASELNAKIDKVLKTKKTRE